MKCCIRDVADRTRCVRIALACTIAAVITVACGDAATDPSASTLRIEPAGAWLVPGTTIRLRATGADPSADVEWSSSQPGIAAVGEDGTVVAHERGTAEIRAVLAGGKAGAVALVEVGMPAAIEVAPGAPVLDAIGDTVQLAAVARDDAGRAVAAPVEWKSSAPAIATVNAAGEVIAKKVGTVVVIATLGAAVDSAVVRVEQPVATLDLASIGPLQPGDSARLAIDARDRLGQPIAKPGLTWSSDAPNVARVAGGWVHAETTGSALIIATAGTQSDTTRVVVEPKGVAARAADAFVESIGVNTRLRYFDTPYGSGFHSIIVPRVRELGVRHLRDGGRVFPSQPVWMETTYGRFRELAEQTGARFTIVMSPLGNTNNFSDMRHVHTLLNAIGPQHVEAFEGLNEHDHFGSTGWVAQVRTAQRALWDEIQKDPALADRYDVLGPSLGTATRAGAVGDLSGYMDFAVAHPYPGGRAPLTNLESQTESLRTMNGSRPLIVTETGYHNALAHSGSHRPVPAAVSGRYIPRLYLEFFTAGVRRTFVHELIDQGWSSSDKEQNFGLLRPDGTPKPAFIALRNLIDLLEDPGPSFAPRSLAFQLTGDTTGVRQLLLQKRDGRFYLAVWRDVSLYDTQSARTLSNDVQTIELRLARPAAAARVYAPADGTSPIASHGTTDRIRLDVPDHVILIEITP